MPLLDIQHQSFRQVYFQIQSSAVISHKPKKKLQILISFLLFRDREREGKKEEGGNGIERQEQRRKARVRVYGDRDERRESGGIHRLPSRQRGPRIRPLHAPSDPLVSNRDNLLLLLIDFFFLECSCKKRGLISLFLN